MSEYASADVTLEFVTRLTEQEKASAIDFASRHDAIVEANTADGCQSMKLKWHDEDAGSLIGFVKDTINTLNDPADGIDVRNDAWLLRIRHITDEYSLENGAITDISIHDGRIVSCSESRITMQGCPPDPYLEDTVNNSFDF